jgi:hypothetical protein
MTRVFKAKDILQLVVNGFDDAAFSEDELIERGKHSGFHVLF